MIFIRRYQFVGKIKWLCRNTGIINQECTPYKLCIFSCSFFWVSCMKKPPYGEHLGNLTIFNVLTLYQQQIIGILNIIEYINSEQVLYQQRRFLPLRLWLPQTILQIPELSIFIILSLMLSFTFPTLQP